MTGHISLTLSQLVSDESFICSILSFRLGDHHGGERGDEAVPQGHVQCLSCRNVFILLSTNVTGRQKRKRRFAGCFLMTYDAHDAQCAKSDLSSFFEFTEKLALQQQVLVKVVKIQTNKPALQ